MASPSSSSGPPVDEGRRSNRTYALGGFVVGAALGLVAGSQPWWRAEAAGLDASFSGTESTGGISQALAFVVAAGALLLLTLSVRGRQVIAALLALVGCSMAVLGVLRLRPSAEAVRDQIRTISLADQFSLSPTAWPWVYAAAGAVVVLAAADHSHFDRIAGHGGPLASNEPPLELGRRTSGRSVAGDGRGTGPDG